MTARRALAASAGALLVAAPAAAASTPRTVEATVRVVNATAAPLSGWRVKVSLGRSTRLVSASGVAPSRRTATLTLRGRRAIPAGATRTLKVRIRGRALPKHWALGSRACSAGKAQRTKTATRVSIRCATPKTAGTSSGATPVPAPVPAPPPSSGSASAWFRFSPYADIALASPPDLAAARAAGVPHVTLGFVTASQGTACVPTWGGYDSYPATGTGAYQRSAVEASRAAGGDVVVSFGGASGSELATVCSSASDLAAAYQKVIDAYGATHIDFDVEGAAIADTAANTRRAQAIAQLQKTAAAAGRPLAVAYTLPVLPTGLDENGVALLKNAVGAGDDVSLVNVMAMDYGDGAAPNPSGRMGQYAIDAGTATAGQLRTILGPGADAFARLGVTPMIGVNDDSTEVFTLSDARALAAWATQQHIGALAMWSLARDRKCSSAQASAQDDCSSIDQSPSDFSHVLGAYTG